MSDLQIDRKIAAEDSVKVLCRFRPLDYREIENGSMILCKFPESSNSVLWDRKLYSFDHVFQPEATQEQVYHDAARTIVSDVLSGFNGTIFAYGQTSSGKTHTMEGEIDDLERKGIIPRIIDDIFNHIYSLEEDLEFHIKVSFFEIYIEKIRDLLDITKINLSIHEDKNRVPYVKGLTERFVTNRDDVYSIIEEGKRNRHFAVTNMNEHSSRSHSIFCLTVKQESLENQKILLGKLYLVDLAGSEKVSKSGAEGTALEETKYINKSLSALGNVINALSEGKPFIPYRDSKLTRVLQESLGGNSRTTVIICCSPASYNRTETKYTLEFGIRAKTVKNVVCVNEELTAEEWKARLEREKKLVVKLRAKIQSMEVELERWRSGDRVPAEERVETRILMEEPVPVEVPTREPLGEEELQRLQAERDKLYKQLDEKDDEINQQTQLVDVLKDEMLEQEELISTTRRRLDLLQQKMTRVQTENENAKEEMKEVLQALEDLALNYDQKCEEFETRNKEYECLADELSKRQFAYSSTLAELQQLKDMSAQQKKKTAQLLTDLLNDLREIGVAIGGVKNMNVLVSSDRKLEEELAAARVYTSRMKSEVQNLVQRCNALENMQTRGSMKLSEYEKDLANCKNIISQHESRVKTLQESVRDAEFKKRALQNDFDTLKEECARLKTIECKAACNKDPTIDDSENLRQILESQMNQFRDLHQHQVTSLRDEIMQKQVAINELKQLNEKYHIANQRLQEEFEKYKETQCRSVCNRRDGNESQRQSREMAREELRGLEDTVARELQKLQNLQKIFLQDLQSRIEESVDAKENGDTSGFHAQKETIRYLENNLEQLIQVNRQLVQDNSNLRCELPKLERRLTVAIEKVRALEGALKNAKEIASEDAKKHYLQELDLIKEAFRNRTMSKRRNSALIAKPIRTGRLNQTVS